MGKADILKALVKLNKYPKVENEDGDMVQLLDNDNKVDVDSLRDEEYEICKEVYFQTIEEIMDAHGEKVIPKEFGQLYNELVNETEPEEEEEEAEVTPSKAAPRGKKAKQPAKPAKEKPAKKEKVKAVKAEATPSAPPEDTSVLIVKLLVKFRATAEILVTTIDETIKAIEKK